MDVPHPDGRPLVGYECADRRHVRTLAWASSVASRFSEPRSSCPYGYSEWPVRAYRGWATFGRLEDCYGGRAMMQPIRSGLRWTMQKLRNLRALVKDEDHDSWLDSPPSSEK